MTFLVQRAAKNHCFNINPRICRARRLPPATAEPGTDGAAGGAAVKRAAGVNGNGSGKMPTYAPFPCEQTDRIAEHVKAST